MIEKDARRESWLVRGLRRYLTILVLLAAVTSVAAGLVVWLTSAGSRTFAVAFYLAGAVLIVGGFMSATVGPVRGTGLIAPGPGYVPEVSLDRLSREAKRRDALAYVGLGIPLLVLGFLLDSLL